MQVLQHLFLLRKHINAIYFPKPYCMGRSVHGSCEQQVSLFLLVSELGDKKSFMGGPHGREESFPFFFFSLLHKQAVKNTLPSAGRMSLFAFNCTFQQIYQLLLCHLFARGWGVKGGYPKMSSGRVVILNSGVYLIKSVPCLRGMF